MNNNSPTCWMIPLFMGIILISTMSGCGGRAKIESQRTAVEGTVAYDGQPLPGGSITFVSAENAKFRVTTMIRHDGSFRVANAPKGSVNISVETESLRLGAPAEDYVQIPIRYADPATSDLVEQIVPEGPALSIELTP